MTGLDSAPGNASNHYLAPDFDTLVDSPIVAGNPAVYPIDVDGVTHYLVNTNESGLWDGAAAAKDVEKIAREYKRMWGFFPFSKYVFLNMIMEAGGGLEHKNSVVMMTSRYSFRLKETGEPSQQQQRGTYQGWLGLVSHEYFHAWNVKRLRPSELGPFDYENEVYTRSLWISEGFTSYYGPLALRRAGLTTRDQYLAALSRTIESLQTTPGRLVQPLEQSSFDTWIKHYRPDENSPNTAISYYTKGAIVGFLLDAKIRKLTANAKSLDDVMRLAYERYAGEKGFTPQQFRRTASDVAGQDLSAWFTKALDTTEELDYTEALEWLGLQLKASDKKTAKATTGLETKVDNGRILVSQVKRGTPGFDAGVNVNDELIAVDDLRVRPGAVASAAGAIQARRHGHAVAGPPGPTHPAPREAQRRAREDLAGGGESESHRRAEGQLEKLAQGIIQRYIFVPRTSITRSGAQSPM
jgi:predicted metalloprotease with PDZ domain